MDGVYIFSAQIYRVGLIRYVDVPADISIAIGGNAPHIAVKGEVDGASMQTTLVSRGHGAYRLALHSNIRKKLQVDAGAVVEIAMERDEASREPTLPPALLFAFRNSPKAQAVFRQMTTALRRQIVRYLTSVKQQATLERRVATLVRRLEIRPLKTAKSAKRKIVRKSAKSPKKSL